MCGRFTQFIPLDIILQHFNLQEAIDLPPRYNIAPTQQIPAIRYVPEKPYRQLTEMRWGLIPHWAKDEKIGYKLLNARGETITKKPAFRVAFKHRRCLLPTSGFYEWEQTEKQKQPFFISMKTEEPFAFAGIWERWENSAGEKIESCAIITTEANAIISKIHHRMPVIIAPGNYDLWLHPDTAQMDLLAMLTPYPPEMFQIYPVSRTVNSPKNETSRCIEQLSLF